MAAFRQGESCSGFRGLRNYIYGFMQGFRLCVWETWGVGAIRLVGIRLELLARLLHDTADGQNPALPTIRNTP